MNNQPIVLCDEDLVEIHGCGLTTMIIAGAVAWAVGKAMSAAAGGAVAAYDAAGSGLSALNSALGPPGTYNPYSNPINCEYAGYY
jgi:hypothetical protein